MDESEKLLPAISDLLKKSRRRFNEIEGVAVVCGPGPFSAVRIGVTVANTLAKILNVPVFEIDTPSLYWLRLQNPKMTSPRLGLKEAVLLLHAGGNFVSMFFQKKSVGILPIQEALKLAAKKLKTKSMVFFGDITENEMREFSEAKRKNWQFLGEDDLKKFSSTVALAPAKSFKKVLLASPIYCRPPNITPSKKL